MKAGSNDTAALITSPILSDGSSPPSTKPPRCSQSTLLGVVCLILCLITWEAMGEMLQDVNVEYPKPAMLTFIVHSWYASLLIPWTIYRRNELKVTLLKHWTMVKLSLYLFPLMWLAAYLWYVSLRQTRVSANNAIYQSQCVFVYIVSLFILGERFDIKKASVLSICVFGVVLVIFTADRNAAAGGGGGGSSGNSSNITSPSSGPGKIVIHETLWGYSALLLGVVAFAIYEVLFKRFEQQAEEKKKEEKRAAGRLGSAGMTADSMSESQENFEASIIFLGLCGVVNICLGWPFVPIFDAIGWETFLLPNNHLTKQIMLNGFIDTIFNFAFIWGVALTSPVFMSTGTILIIPLGIFVDGFIGKGWMNFWQLCGVGFIVIGFLGLNYVEHLKKKMKKKNMSEESRRGGMKNNSKQLYQEAKTENNIEEGSQQKIGHSNDVVATNAEDMW